MTGLTAYTTSGGSADVVDYPLEETHPIDNLQDIDEAVAYANEALEAAERLEEAQLNSTPDNALANQLLKVAVENYIERFQIPTAALESEEDGDKDEAGRLKKVILYLYAIVQRIFKALFDFFRNQKLVARKLMPLTKVYIGEADSLTATLAGQMNIKDRSLMVALHIDGIAPKKIPEQFDRLAETFEKQYQFSSVSEVVRLISAAKEKNQERVVKEAEILRARLEAGLKAALTEVEPRSTVAFSEKKVEGNTYFASDVTFGQNYIFGIVGDQVSTQGTFTYRCGIRRDAEVPLRVPAFPVLTPDEIRHVCRTSLRVCENIIRFSRDEELLQKALREATFLTTKEADKSSVIALRNITAVGQNSYIVHLRFVTRTMQSLMRWCAASIKRYQTFGSENG